MRKDKTNTHLKGVLGESCQDVISMRKKKIFKKYGKRDTKQIGSRRHSAQNNYYYFQNHCNLQHTHTNSEQVIKGMNLTISLDERINTAGCTHVPLNTRFASPPGHFLFLISQPWNQIKTCHAMRMDIPELPHVSTDTKIKQNLIKFNERLSESHLNINIMLD